METTVSPALVWAGELRLAVVVPPDWSDAEQDDLDASLMHVSLRLADTLRTLLPKRCVVEPRVV